MAAAGSASSPGAQSPYLWLAQESVGQSSERKWEWVPLPRADSERLEAILASAAGKELPKAVPVDHGRYDVVLERRVLRAVYWDEPERRCIRSSWFRGKIGGPWVPYEEEDAEGLETAFQRLRSAKEKGSLLVPVNRGTDDVRFEALPPEGVEDDSSTLTMFFGSGQKRYSVLGVVPKSDESTKDESQGNELLFTAVQEEVARGGGSGEKHMVWRGYWVVAGEEKSAEENEVDKLPNRVECLTFVVHGIGQYHRAQQGENSQFFKEVSRVRKLAMKYQRERMEEQGQGEGSQPSGRIEFLPLEWYGPIHVDVGIGNRLKNVTLKSVSSLRDFANFALADVMVYLDDQWRERIHEELLRKMANLWKLFSERTSDYSGEVAVIGHSLGSVIMFDLMQKGLEKLPQGLHCSPSKDTSGSPKKTMVSAPAKPANVATPGSIDRKGIKILKDHMAKGNIAPLAKGGHAAYEHPVPRCLFAVGSPLGMFLSIRLSQKAQRASRYFRGLDVRWPAVSEGRGWRMFNVFHPDDPIAYRIEPLLNPAYASMNPRVVPHKGGLRWNHQIKSWFSTSASKSPDGGMWDLEGQETFEEVLVVPTEDPASFFEEKPARQSVVTVDRVDYALQVSAFESMNEMLSAIHSHFSYWENEDLLRFIVDQIFESLQTPSKARSSK